ncbi:uncharacterized protein K02A2.6-like [Ochlerotatus camptorhynchus]|uniref:uncharacterized protein K02A2.6-like n=1 Tax=Ochlerotatus camptorhynchus TaxID=644619 RepID=UPI0031D8844B
MEFQSTLRIQRFALNLLSYDFDIEYVSTEKFGNADLLSRLINQHVKPKEDYVIASLNLEEDLRSKSIATSKTAGPSLNSTGQTFVGSNRDRNRSPWWIGASYLPNDIIPSLHQKRYLEQLHRGHLGMQRMKAIARSYVYWPSLDADIVNFVKACQQCASVARSPPHSPPVPCPKPTAPRPRVHVDFVGLIEGEYYLFAIDSFSKWPEIIQTTRITSAASISILRGLFARLGMPVSLVSDNGTQFTSAEFADF